MIVKLTDITDKQLNSILKIWLKSNIEAHDFISPSYWKDNYEYVKQLLPQSEIWAYYQNQKIIGFTGLSGNYIAGIFVDSHFRKQGIGTALLNNFKKNHGELSLTVYEKNNNAFNFYQKQNFKIIKNSIDKNTNEKEYTMLYHK